MEVWDTEVPEVNRYSDVLPKSDNSSTKHAAVPFMQSTNLLIVIICAIIVLVVVFLCCAFFCMRRNKKVRI